MRRFESFIDKQEKEKERGIVPSATGTDSVGQASSISKAVDMKKVSSGIGMAQQGAALLGVGGEGDSSVEGGAASGALSGAAMGAQVGGPYGAIIGGVVGGVAGGMGASAKQKAAYNAAKQRAKAVHEGNLGRIEEDKDRKIQGALESMKSAFSKNFQNNKSVKL